MDDDEADQTTRQPTYSVRSDSPTTETLNYKAFLTISGFVHRCLVEGSGDGRRERNSDIRNYVSQKIEIWRMWTNRKGPTKPRSKEWSHGVMPWTRFQSCAKAGIRLGFLFWILIFLLLRIYFRKYCLKMNLYYKFIKYSIKQKITNLVLMVLM